MLPYMIYLTGYTCTMYEDGIGRVIEDYRRACVTCPFKYQSNDSIKCKATFKLSTEVKIIKKYV